MGFHWRPFIVLFIGALVVSVALPGSAVILTKYEHWQYIETTFEPLEARFQKMTLIHGMLNGIKAVSPERLSEDVPGVDTLVWEIDSFYKDPANRNIPVVWLLIVADHKLAEQELTNSSNRQFERELERLRDFYKHKEGIPLP